VGGVIQINTVVKWNQRYVYLTTKFDLTRAGLLMEVSVLAEILLPDNQRFSKLSLFQYNRLSKDLRGYLCKYKEDAIHNLKNELLVSAFGHEVRQAQFRMNCAQTIIDG
jgi:hypothetical protein